ncbi:MAG: YggS family pyridoxal phosphate-dependent enzyme [Candidatus Borkfalkiaceae bacterium]|nr:YggS family pyridoxal phosphate-dependent enzyme [Christensenellaceae bacterium]
MNEENLKKILEFAARGNAFGEKVTVVGATKTIPADIINRAIADGLKVVAENKVNEFREKTDLIRGAEQHFIGHLQTNKVKYIVGKVSLIHSVDSLKLAAAISDECVKKNVEQPILIQINVGNEETKSGFSPSETERAAEEISRLPLLKVKGLMAMLPKTENTLLLRELSLQMRGFYDKLKEKYDFTTLSMGMSSDYKIAVECGSNTVRIGSLIFGERNYEVKK